MTTLRTLLVGSLLISLSRGSTYAQSLTDQGLCTNLSPRQLQTIQGITTITQKADTISARLVNNDPGASALIERTLQDRQRQLSESCNFQKLQRYARTMVNNVIRIKQQYEQFQTLTSSPEAEAAMIDLQQHLLGLATHIDPTIYTKPFDATSTTTLTLDANIPDMGKGTLSVTIGSKGQFDLSNNRFATTIQADVVMSLQQFLDQTKISLKALGNIDITMVDDLYIRINNLSLQGTSSNQDNQQQLSTASTMIQKTKDILANTFVNLTTSDNTNHENTRDPISNLQVIAGQQATTTNLLAMMNTTSMMKFYREEDKSEGKDIYYGYTNPLICDIMPQGDTRTSCLASMTEDLYRQRSSTTLLLGSEKLAHTLAIDAGSMFDTSESTIQRNKKAITNITIPLGESGNALTYNNEQLTISVKDETAQLSIQGSLNNKGSNIKGTFSGPNGYKGTMSRQTSANTSNTTHNYLYNLGITVYQNTAQLINLSIKNSQTINTTNVAPIIKPASSITLEQAFELLKGAIRGATSSQ